MSFSKYLKESLGRVIKEEDLAPDPVEAYLQTARWAENRDEQEDWDDLEFSEEARAIAKKDVNDFIRQAGSLLDGLDLSQVVHDFWLTRNGHGAGFWDGDYDEDIGEKLTQLSKKFGEKEVYVGDDGLLYFS